MNSDNTNQGEEKGNVNSISCMAPFTSSSFFLALTVGDKANKECHIVHQSTKRPISDSELLEGQESVHISKRSQLDSSGGSDEPSDDSKPEEATNDSSELNFEHEYKQLLKSMFRPSVLWSRLPNNHELQQQEASEEELLL